MVEEEPLPDAIQGLGEVGVEFQALVKVGRVGDEEVAKFVGLGLGESLAV